VQVAVGRDLQDLHEVVVAEGEQHVSRLHSEAVRGWRLLEPPDGCPVAHVDEGLRPLVVVLIPLLQKNPREIRIRIEK
jgi:hypothetical protein